MNKAFLIFYTAFFVLFETLTLCIKQVFVIQVIKSNLYFITKEKKTHYQTEEEKEELDGLKVFITPQLTNGRFFVGCNGNDYMSSAAV